MICEASIKKLETEKIDVKIYKLYILMLPVGMLNIFQFLVDSPLQAIANKTNFLIHILGLLLILYNTKTVKMKFNNLMKYTIFMILILNISSGVMAIILHNKLGVLHGENTFTAIFGMLIYYTHVLSIFVYNYVMIKTINIIVIKKLLKILTLFTLFLGYIQVLILINASFAKLIYDNMDVFGVLADSDFLLRMDRITGFGSEPASFGNFMGIIVIPFILSQIISSRNKIQYTLILIIFLPLLYYSKSSTTYILFATNIAIFLFFILSTKKLRLKNIIAFSLLCIIILTITFYKINYDNNAINKYAYDEIKYLTINKILDNDNHSTLMRKSTIVNDIAVFKKYPILGIGNGNQGFYYNENVPYYYLKSSEVKNIISGSSGIVNGGAFVPAFISGYGLFGVFLLVIFGYKCKNIMHRNKEKAGYIYYLYFIGAFGFIISAFMSTDIVGNHIAIFILSIPFLFNNELSR